VLLLFCFVVFNWAAGVALAGVGGAAVFLSSEATNFVRLNQQLVTWFLHGVGFLSSLWETPQRGFFPFLVFLVLSNYCWCSRETQLGCWCCSCFCSCC
jgi:hypothetical protein